MSVPTFDGVRIVECILSLLLPALMLTGGADQQRLPGATTSTHRPREPAERTIDVRRSDADFRAWFQGRLRDRTREWALLEYRLQAEKPFRLKPGLQQFVEDVIT